MPFVQAQLAVYQAENRYIKGMEDNPIQVSPQKFSRNDPRREGDDCLRGSLGLRDFL